MSDQSIWYLENIDVAGLFCPKKLGAGEMDKHSHKEFRLWTKKCLLAIG